MDELAPVTVVASRSIEIRDPERGFETFEVAARAVIAAKRSPHTRSAYLVELRRWLDYCRHVGLDPLAPLLVEAAQYRDVRLTEAKPVSVNRTLAALSAIHRPLVQARMVRGNPFHPSILAWPPAPSQGVTPAVSDVDVDALLGAAVQAGDVRAVAILTLLRDTGLRRASVAEIRRESIERLGDDGATFKARVKGSKDVEIEVPGSTAAAMFAWSKTLPATPGPLFPAARDATRPIHPIALNKLIVAYARKVGLDHPVSPHQFRAAFVTKAFDLRIPMREIQQAVHHESEKTTQRYDRGRRGARVIAEVQQARSARSTR